MTIRNKRNGIKSGFAFGVLWVLLFSSCREKPAYSSDLPPIFLITLDTTRRDFLSPYNPLVASTPEIGKFANTATTFENAYATAPWTLPSHASMFSGYFPSRHGAGVTHTKLPNDLHLVTQFLKSKGYRSAGYSGGPFTSSRYGFHRGFDEFSDHEKPFTRASRQLKKAREFLAKSSVQPPFVFINLFDPHAPYHPPSEFGRKFGLSKRQNQVEKLSRWKDSFGGYGLLVKKLVTMGVPEPEVVDYLHAAYSSEIAFVDEELGAFFDWLEKNNLFDRALIIVLADHGEYLGEEGRYFHSYSLDPLLTHIPLIVKWPGQKMGKRNSSLASQVDIFGTILKAARCEIPANDGIPLDELVPDLDRWVLMEEHRIEPIHPLVHEEFLLAESIYGIQTSLVRGIVWEGKNQCEKLIHSEWQVIDCGHDWQEDLAFIQKQIQTVPKKEQDSKELDEEEKELLRSLGYIQ